MLHAILRRIAPLAIAVAALSACNSDATLAPRPAPIAQASAQVITTPVTQISRDQATVPFFFGVYAPCANGGQGEVLDGTGELSYRGIWSMINDGQRHHSVVIDRFVGTVIGWDSGEEYDVTTRTVSQDNIAEGGDGIPDSGEQMQRMQFRLTSRATGAVIDIVLTMRFVEAPTGEWVLDGWDGVARCR